MTRFLSILLLSTIVAVPVGAATIVVTIADDLDVDDAECSLREAILAAESDGAYHGCAPGSGADLVVFDLPTPAVLPLDSILPAISSEIHVAGPGADRLTIDGQDATSLFELPMPNAGGQLELRDLTLARGASTTRAGAVSALGDNGIRLVRVVATMNRSAFAGGVVLVVGQPGRRPTLRIEDSILAANQALEGSFGGGAVWAGEASVEIVRSSLVGNMAVLSPSGALHAWNSLVRLEQATVSGNWTHGSGGGILLAADNNDLATLTIEDSTITDNECRSLVDRVAVAGDETPLGGDGSGGGIFATGDAGAEARVTLANSIVAGNSDQALVQAPDLSFFSNVVWETQGFNLIGSNAGAESLVADGLPNSDGDYVGTEATPIDPRLGALGFRGGPTPTHRPLPDAASLTLDHGLCRIVAADQRGYANAATGERAFDQPMVPDGSGSDGCDIGAVELGTAPATGSPLFADGFESATPLVWSLAIRD